MRRDLDLNYDLISLNNSASNLLCSSCFNDNSLGLPDLIDYLFNNDLHKSSVARQNVPCLINSFLFIFLLLLNLMNALL